MMAVVVLTFDLEVMTSKVVRVKVEGQWCVGLIQEQVDPGHLDPVPFKHRTQNLSGKTQKIHSVIRPSVRPHTSLQQDAPVLSPQAFLFHGRDDLSVYVHVEVKLEGEALLTGVLQRGTGCQRHRDCVTSLLSALTSVWRLLGFFFTNFIPPVLRSLQISYYATRQKPPAESDQTPSTSP